MIDEVIEAAKGYDELPFTIDGVESNPHHDESGRFIHFKIIPSRQLTEFRAKLWRKLATIAVSEQPWDNSDDFLPHVTIETHLGEGRFNKEWARLNGYESLLSKFFRIVSRKWKKKSASELYLPATCLRITILNEQRKIIREYDLQQKVLLDRRQALNRQIWAKTLREFRQANGMEIAVPEYVSTGARKKTFLLISDTHFDHDNIIKYCARPFANVQEMNQVLLNNWNNTVKPDDDIYFLGDLAFGRGARPATYWLNQLNGNIQFVAGNHDRNIPNPIKDAKLTKNGIDFLLVHDPKDVPKDWKGWVIHGDKHNNDLKKYPFINGEKRRINVSAEVVKYRPVSLDEIVSLIPTVKTRIETR